MVCGATDSDHRKANCPEIINGRRCKAAVQGCIEAHPQHRCMVCGATDSDHRKANCPEIIDGRRCKAAVQGCIEAHPKHRCTVCHNPDSDHRKANCPLRFGAAAVRHGAATDPKIIARRQPPVVATPGPVVAAPGPVVAAAVPHGWDKKTIYFMRHGESIANVRQDHDIYDPDLTGTGMDQATTISRYTKHLGIEAVICSPLKRSIMTTSLAFSGLKVPLYIDPRFREVYVHQNESRGKPGSRFIEYARDMTRRYGLRLDEASAQTVDNRRSQWWNPDEEVGKFARKITVSKTFAQSMLRETLPSLWERAETCFGVVTHYGVIKRLFPQISNPKNCELYKVEIIRNRVTGKVQVFTLQAYNKDTQIFSSLL